MFSAFLHATRDHPSLKEVLRTLRPRISRSRFRCVCRYRRQFLRFCRAYKLTPLPAEPSTVARYMQALRPHHTSKSIGAVLTPVCAMHREAGYPSPRRGGFISKLFRAYEKEDAVKRELVESYTLEQFEEICQSFVREDIYTRRLHAVVTCAFWGELEALEIVQLNLNKLDRFEDHWVFRDVGIRRRRVTLDRCRNPQRCPINALERWLAVAGLTEGLVFRAVSYWTGEPFGRALTRSTIAQTWEGARSDLPPHLPRLPLMAFRAGHQVASFHAGVSYATMAVRGGYTKQIDLLRRLHKIITPRPEGRRLEPIGRRAASGRRQRRKLTLGHS